MSSTEKSSKRKVPEEEGYSGSFSRDGEYKYYSRNEHVLVVDVLSCRAEDTRLLTITLGRLGFSVNTVAGVQNAAALISLVKRESALSNEVFLCFVLGDDGTDGNTVGIVTADGSCVDREELAFAASVEAMHGKPKIFFFDGSRTHFKKPDGHQATKSPSNCKRFRRNSRGERLLDENPEASTSYSSSETEIRDTLIAHSTIAGGVSLRSSENYSLYIAVFCRELLELRERREISSILESVGQKIRVITGGGAAASQ